MTPKIGQQDNDDVQTWQTRIDSTLSRMDERLRVIERLVWIAVGGTVVIGAIVGFGLRIVEKQADKLEDVTLRQAATIAERRANEEASKRRDADLQGQLDKLRERK